MICKDKNNHFQLFKLLTLCVLTLILILQTIAILQSSDKKMKYSIIKNASHYNLFTIPFELDSRDD